MSGEIPYRCDGRLRRIGAREEQELPDPPLNHLQTKRHDRNQTPYFERFMSVLPVGLVLPEGVAYYESECPGADGPNQKAK